MSLRCDEIMVRLVSFSIFVLIAATIMGLAKPAPHPNPAVRINQPGFDYARKLIAEGHFVNDKHGNWATDRVSTRDGNEFLRQRGSQEYAQWHLGLDECHQVGRKGRYKFPFGDFKNVHRCALIAVQNRARQYGYGAIESAASELLKLMEQQQ